MITRISPIHQSWVYPHFLNFFLLIFCYSYLYSQNLSKTDSLIQRLEKVKDDSLRIEILIELSSNYSGNDPGKSKFYAEQILMDSAISNHAQISRAYFYLGYCYYDWSKSDSALIQFEKAYRYAEMSNETRRMLQIAIPISDCNKALGNYKASFNVAFDALRLADSVKDNYRMGIFNGRIGELYRDQFETEKAIQYLKQSYEDFSVEDRRKWMMSSKINLALAYKQIDAEKALETYNDLLSEFTDLFNLRDSALFHSNLGNIYIDLERFEEAESHLMKALECHKRLNRPISRAFVHKELAVLYERTNRPEEVIKYAHLALERANESGHTVLQHQSSDQLSKAYAVLGQYDQAYKYLQSFMSFRDSIRSEEKIALSNKLEAEYATEKKEQQIQLQQEQLARQQAEMNKELILRNALIGGVILLIVIGAITYRSARAQIRKNREIKQYASKIEELQANQSRWFTNIAHELRTPLTLILGPIQNMLRQPETSLNLKDEVSLAKKYGDQLIKRVNEILEISRLESGKLVLNEQPTDMVNLIKQVVSSFDSMAVQKEVELEFDYEIDLILRIDPEKVASIIGNLVSNAIKFTPVNGRVLIELTRDVHHSTVNIKVADSGIGISAEDIPHVFDRFYQAHGTGEDPYGGSGVGLTLSQELAKLHGGLINVSSQPPDGSTFIFSLPDTLVCEETIVPVADQEIDHLVTNRLPKLPPLSDEPKYKILLVEDHQDMRQYIRHLLQDYYEVTEANDGQEGLEKLLSHSPDLIISDVKMPVMDGLTFAKKLRENEKHRLIPFISLTAHANEKDKLTALKTGVDDYLVKPFDAEELMIRIGNLISNAKERKKIMKDRTSTESIDDLTHNEKLIANLEMIVKERLPDSSFSVAELAHESAMSQSTLGRLVKKMTGLTPGQFIRDIRLQHAMHFLESHQYGSVSEVVYAVGFEDVSSFSRLFKQRFGRSPSSYSKCF